MRFLTRWLRSQLSMLRGAAGIRQLSRYRPLAHRGRAWPVAMLAVAGLLAVFVASALAFLSGSPSKFEAGDGNMTVETSGNADWNCLSSISGVKVSEGSATCGKVNTENYVSLPAPHAYTAEDPAWKPGQKQDTSCPVLVEGKSPGKDTFTHVASYNETALVEGKLGSTYLYGATLRFTANGNASENVELNQKEGTNECSIPRTAGDKLIAINYLNGGTKVEIAVLTWITVASPNVGGNNGTCLVEKDKPPCWGAKEKSLTTEGSEEAEGEANQKEIAAEYNGLNKTTVLAGQFAEFGVNLTKAGIIPEGSCHGFAQTVWESRSSGSSFTSNPEDIEIEKHPISNCGAIKVIKETVPAGLNQVFEYTSSLPATETGGVTCPKATGAGINSEGKFCLNANTTGSETANKVEVTELNPGTYKIKEGTEPAGFGFGSVKCTSAKGAKEPESTTETEVSVTLEPLDTVTCVYTNKQELGALKILKTSSKAAATPLSGAKFTIKDPEGKELSGSPFETNTEGVVCVDKLTALGEYTVQETKAPTGYSIDEEKAKTIKVTGTNAKCSDTSFKGQELKFTDTPLTNVSITAESQVKGGTKSTIECKDSSTEPKSIGNSPQEGEKATVSAEGLKPGTYNCKVVVDP